MGVRVSFSNSNNRNWLKVRAALFGCLCLALISSGCRDVLREKFIGVIPPDCGDAKPVKMQINTPLSATVGERLWITAGSWFRCPIYEMGSDVLIEIPGRDGQKWKTAAFEIKKTTLTWKFQTENHKYYCAPKTKASWVDRKTDDGDEDLSFERYMGVRRSKQTGILEWFAILIYSPKTDRPRREVYFRKVRLDEEEELTLNFKPRYDPNGAWAALYYLGYFDKKIHFEWQASSEDSDTGLQRVFQFHLDKDHPPTRIVVKDFALEVLDVDNVKLRYQWIEN